MSTAQQKTLEDFLELQKRSAVSHAIKAAVELGVIRALREGQRTATQLAKSLNVYPEALTQLLEVVAETELLEKYGEDYALSNVARLIPDAYMDLGESHWQHLAFYVRTGAPLPICEEIPATDSDYVINKSTEEWTLTPAALSAAKALDLVKSRRGIRMLELGCSSAVFGATLAHSAPDAVITLVDDAPSLSRARTTVESIGLERKVTFVEADSIDDLTNIPELVGETFDLVLLAGRVNRMTLGDCRRLFTQIYPLTKPDRELAIIDVFPGQADGNRARSIFELELSLRTSRGRLHGPRDLEAALKESGFGQVQYAHLPTAPYYWGLMLAQR